MSDTKEKIMMTALRLFAKDGYEAQQRKTLPSQEMTGPFS